MKLPGLLREPLLHFLLGGAALFGLYALVRPAPPPTEQTVVLTAGDLSGVEGRFEARWHRAPSAAELKRRVDDRTTEEVLYREGLSLGLDRDDPVVRERVARKMAYLLRSRAEPPTPDEATLRAWFAAHRERFAIPARVSFAQVWFDPTHRTDAEADARAALQALRDLDQPPADARFLGDPPPRGATFTDVDPATVRADFGQDFATTLLATPAGDWQGPLASEDGWRLARVTAREGLQPRDFAQAEDAVRADWRAAQEHEADAEALARLRARYHVELKPISGDLEAP